MKSTTSLLPPGIPLSWFCGGTYVDAQLAAASLKKVQFSGAPAHRNVLERKRPTRSRLFLIWVQLGSKTLSFVPHNSPNGTIRATESTRLWRKRVGVEPKLPTSNSRRSVLPFGIWTAETATPPQTSLRLGVWHSSAATLPPAWRSENGRSSASALACGGVAAKAPDGQ